MTTIFENNDFRLLSTGHSYDFVGIIENKTAEPLTFFFSEEEVQVEATCDEWETDEDETKLLDVCGGLEPDDEEQETALLLCAGGSLGFLSNPQQRGRFLAIVKAFCPEQLKNIPWA